MKPGRRHVAERLPAVVAEASDRRVELGLVGRHGAPFAGRDDLARVEREARRRHQARRTASRGSDAPSAPAASSTSTTSCGIAVCSASHSTGRPKRCTAMTARVRGVTAAATAAASRLNVSGVDVDENGPRAAQLDDVRRRGERVGRDDAPRRPGRSRARGARGAAPRFPTRRPRRAPCRPRRAIARSNSSTFGPIVSWPVLDDLRDRSELLVPDIRPREPNRLGHAGRVLPVPRDRALEALVELDLRLEAEELARLVDVRHPQLDVACSGAAGTRAPPEHR